MSNTSYTIAFLTIVLVITFHASLVQLSTLSLISESITLDITYHPNLADSDNSDDIDGLIFFFRDCNK